MERHKKFSTYDMETSISLFIAEVSANSNTWTAKQRYRMDFYESLFPRLISIFHIEAGFLPTWPQCAVARQAEEGGKPY